MLCRDAGHATASRVPDLATPAAQPDEADAVCPHRRAHRAAGAIKVRRRWQRHHSASAHIMTVRCSEAIPRRSASAPANSSLIA